jgi:AraC-like DNA-binding protein
MAGKREQISAPPIAPATPPDEPSAFRFSTEDFPRRDRIEAWREIVGRAILKVDVERVPGSREHADLALRALPGLNVSEGVGRGMDFRRTPALVDSDDLLLDMSLDGCHLVRQRGREVALGAGEAVLETGAEPLLVSLPRDDHYLVLRVPSRVLAPLIGDLDSVLMRPIPRDSEALRLLIGHAQTLRKLPPLASPELRRLAARHTHDLIALTLGARRDAAEVMRGRGLRAVRFFAIKADIAVRLGRGTLSVGEVAARQAVTPRYVQRLFEAEGTTFSEFVLAQRLLRAQALLRDPHLFDRTITSVAFDVGFRDLSYFNRSFRRRFGATPSDVRAAARLA